MMDTTVSEIIYTGNASTSTPYSITFDYIGTSHIKVSVMAAGTGTVEVVAGVATFSSAQTTLEIGSRVRILGTKYTIATRASSTSFTLTTRPTIAAGTSFHILDDATELVEG